MLSSARNATPWLLLSVLLAACSSNEGGVVIRVVSDYRPGQEVAQVRSLVSAPDGPGVPLGLETRDIAVDDDLLSGLAVARFSGVPPGMVDVLIELIDPTRRILTERQVRTDLPADTLHVVTVVITRTCADVTCPSPGDPAAWTTCRGGTCTSPECTLETPSQCEASCATDSDCPAAGCDEPRCHGGICLRVANDSRCPAGSLCIDGLCGDLPDAGVPGDTGTPPEVDAGPGATYAWVTGDYGSCSSSCGEGEETRSVTCQDESGTEVSPTLCPTPMPEATRSCDAGSSTCGWGSFGSYGSCSDACDSTQTRTRSCNVPDHCSGSSSESRSCDGDACCDQAGDCSSWQLQSCCACSTGRRCEVRNCTRSDCGTEREVRNCITDCPCCV